jgi:hypothetical protein
MFAVPNVALENAMACRVFRILKFDSARANYIDTIMTTEASMPASSGHRSNRVGVDTEAGGHALVDLRSTRVTVTKEVEHDGLDFPYKHDNNSNVRV